MYYTQRRANMPNPQGVDWAHGCSIGIATSPDGSVWTYQGVCQGDKMLSNTDPEKRHTWWAPDVITDEKGLFHMFVTYVPNITTDWSGSRDIRHYTSEDGFNWQCQSVLPLQAERASTLASRRLAIAGICGIRTSLLAAIPGWQRVRTSTIGRLWAR